MSARIRPPSNSSDGPLYQLAAKSMAAPNSSSSSNSSNSSSNSNRGLFGSNNYANGFAMGTRLVQERTPAISLAVTCR